MAGRTFISTLNALAREQARRERRLEAEHRRIQRETARRARDTERSNRLKEKEDKQRYLEARLDETAEKNVELVERIEELQHILEHTLSVNDAITFEALRIRDGYTPSQIPKDLTVLQPSPRKQAFLLEVRQMGFFENLFGFKGRYLRETEAAGARYDAALKSWEASEKKRHAKLAELRAQDEAARQAYEKKVQQRNMEVNDLETAYKNGEAVAIKTYNSMVLERSEYPEGFPQRFRLAYVSESKEIVVEYDFPDINVIPRVAEYRYSRSKDEIEEKPRKSGDIKELYQDIIASTTIRTIHEVLEADQGHHLEIVVFNGYVQAVDLATGKDIRPCLISVRTTREEFMQINLARIEKSTCLRNLGAQVSSQPQALQSVKPVVEFDMVDKRFIEQADVLGELESRPNLMDLNPSEFEALVSNLFAKMGLETKLTRSSRDGGVDAVAFDTRPVLGGKVVIQAKRYKNTVGVSAVRDLYGTMLNEGASKGIIVATSSYGPDAYEFAKDKPLELIDGGGLLYLLDQVGVKARIVIPEEG